MPNFMMDALVPGVLSTLDTYFTLNMSRAREQEVQRRKDAEAAQRREWAEKQFGWAKEKSGLEMDQIKARGSAELAGIQARTDAVIKELEARAASHRQKAEDPGKLTEREKGLIGFLKNTRNEYNQYASNMRIFNRSPIAFPDWFAQRHVNYDLSAIERMEMQSLGIEPTPTPPPSPVPETGTGSVGGRILDYFGLSRGGSPTTPTASPSPPPRTQPTTRERLAGAVLGGPAGADTLERPDPEFEQAIQEMMRLRPGMTRQQAEQELRRVMHR